MAVEIPAMPDMP